MSIVWVLFGFIALCLGGSYGFHRWEQKATVTWKVVAEGAYDHSVVDQAIFASRSGSVVRKTRTMRIPMTRIYFTDGRTIIITDYHPLPAKGTPIKVLKNRLNYFRVEFAQTA